MITIKITIVAAHDKKTIVYSNYRNNDLKAFWTNLRTMEIQKTQQYFMDDTGVSLMVPSSCTYPFSIFLLNLTDHRWNSDVYYERKISG